MTPTISKSTFIRRRTQLRGTVSGPILLMGNAEQARNFTANPLPFRQDSSFWYYTGCTIPNAAWFASPSEDVLFLPSQDPSDVLWHGPQDSNDEIAKRLGFDKWQPRESLASWMSNHTIDTKTVHTIAVADLATTQWLSTLTQQPLQFGVHNGSLELIDAIIGQRRLLDHEELEQLRWTAEITKAAHISAMKTTHIGGHERTVASAFHSPIHESGLTTAYHSIVTVDGEILHNHNYKNTLSQGDLLLLDGGAESPLGYATDVTRTWPVSGHFSERQRRAYEAVLLAQEASIEQVRPGVRYRDVHTTTCRILTEFLVDEGLLLGQVDTLVEQGAHALFFPHGVGHLLGLDVHDMENFGDRAAYAPGRTRSTQFGTGYLRMDLDLEAHMVVTIEPGFYICPAIFADATLRSQFKSAVHWDRLEDWMGFGGIRIEDDIYCTPDGPENLTGSIPKSIEEIEALVGTSH